jgi:F-type H+-transporting ATPase subunit delta
VAEATNLSAIAERYALAVFELAQEEKSVDAVSSDLTALNAALGASADLHRFVRAPVFGRGEQMKGMAALLQQMGVGKLATKFVLLLAAKGRLFVLPDAIKAFEALVAKSHGEIAAEVTAARPLAAAELSDLKKALKAKLGREPRLEAKVDSSLLGGLIVKVGSKMIDSSLRAKLNGLRVAMKS